jgi:hypothetical protein
MRRFSDEYFAHLDHVRDGIAGISAQIIENDSLGRILPEWLAMLFHITRATTPVLHHALDRTQRYDTEDAFIRALRAFYETKLREEAGHELLLLKDLERLGRPRAQVEALLAPANVTAMVGSQYYLIDFCHPAAYLGYIGLLEGYPAKPEQLEDLIRRSGIPREAWSTYKLHAEVDPWHREELEEILNQIPENETRLRQAILANGIRSGEFYYQALEALATSGGQTT